MPSPELIKWLKELKLVLRARPILEESRYETLDAPSKSEKRFHTRYAKLWDRCQEIRQALLETPALTSVEVANLGRMSSSLFDDVQSWCNDYRDDAFSAYGHLRKNDTKAKLRGDHYRQLVKRHNEMTNVSRYLYETVEWANTMAPQLQRLETAAAGLKPIRDRVDDLGSPVQWSAVPAPHDSASDLRAALERDQSDLRKLGRVITGADVPRATKRGITDTYNLVQRHLRMGLAECDRLAAIESGDEIALTELAGGSMGIRLAKELSGDVPPEELLVGESRGTTALRSLIETMDDDGATDEMQGLVDDLKTASDFKPRGPDDDERGRELARLVLSSTDAMIGALGKLPSPMTAVCVQVLAATDDATAQRQALSTTLALRWLLPMISAQVTTRTDQDDVATDAPSAQALSDLLADIVRQAPKGLDEMPGVLKATVQAQVKRWGTALDELIVALEQDARPIRDQRQRERVLGKAWFASEPDEVDDVVDLGSHERDPDLDPNSVDYEVDLDGDDGDGDELGVPQLDRLLSLEPGLGDLGAPVGFDDWDGDDGDDGDDGEDGDEVEVAPPDDGGEGKVPDPDLLDEVEGAPPPEPDRSELDHSDEGDVETGREP